LKVGIETDFERLRVGHLERRNVNFVCADASNLPFCQNSFETVVLIGVLPYLEKPLDALQEVHRVLSDRGHVEISAASAHWYYRFPSLYNWKYKCHYYKSKELENLLINSGFNLKSVYSRGPFIAPHLSNFFIIPNIIDRLAGNKKSVLGPCAQWARTITNPLIQWEYDHAQGDGYQFFATGVRSE
jgi:ubiquinone/menaquinone biosynthesis C-methylase UbiE